MSISEEGRARASAFLEVQKYLTHYLQNINSTD